MAYFKKNLTSQFNFDGAKDAPQVNCVVEAERAAGTDELTIRHSGASREVREATC